MSNFNENENLKIIFSDSLKELNLSLNIINNLNELSSYSKEEPQSKQPIKFISIKLNPIQNTSFLQKKKISLSEYDNSNNGRWDKDEQKRFAEAILKYGNDWKKIQNYVSSRNITQIRSHAQKFLMKLKENNLFKSKQLEKNLSWAKIMNYLNETLSYDELKEILFSVEQITQTKDGNENYKNFRKIKKHQKKIQNNINDSCISSNSDLNNNDLCCYECDSDHNFFNLNEEDKYAIKHKIVKQEEEDKEMLQKFIECFNSSSDNITLNTSFDESSFNNLDYNIFKEEKVYNNSYVNY